ncbi:translocation/assembly module TamB domain-containing protein [Fulvivirga ligni]|uniref:translocation/assembly module TamB domain-containing protein n=1 Tax=Fulvivirga ligni TaxID=2904246 RepID=UPI001F44BC0A|nr:translocation/assembly module TamB domain-containing protein [Fulvivirga ligni]UII20395.1 translocation/assembly module TamB [Fulvivirga ligni]
MAQVIKKRIVKTILWLILSLFLLLVIAAGAIQFPYIQTKLVSYISKHYSELTGYDISIERIAIDWFDEIQIDGLHVIDLDDNQLIGADEIHIDFDIKALINKEEHNIDNITLQNADVYLTKIIVNDTLETLNINELIRRLRKQAEQQSAGRVFISADHVSLINARFSYHDPKKDSLEDLFDYNHFTLANINGEFNNLTSIADTLELNVTQLSLNDSVTQLKVKEFTTKFRVSQSSMEFLDLKAKVGQSTIRDSVIFKYSSTRDLSDFNTKVRIDAHLNNTIVHSSDLALFASPMRGVRDIYQLSGNFNGRISSFTFDNANLKFGQGTALKGTIRMDGLPNIAETFINFDLSNSYVRVTDLKDYVKKKTYARLSPFDRISFSAEFLGFPNDFVANGDFFTTYGRITSDINLKLEEDINQSDYSGKLIMEEFDLGGYSGNKLFQNVSLRGEIKGKGFTLEDANFDLKGKIDKIGINGYEYSNVQTDARFAKEFFQGFMKINDPNLKLTTTGSIDLRKGINIFNVEADLDTAFFKPLNISKKDLFISSEINVNARGLQLDSIIGIADLHHSQVIYNGQSLYVDSLQIVSEKKQGIRQVTLETDLVDTKINGIFDFTVVYNDFKTLLKEYKLNLQNDKEAIKRYYAQKDDTDHKDYKLEYSIDLKDPNPILQLFYPDLYISDLEPITGNIVGGYTSILSINTHFDSLIYKEDEYIDSELQINVSKISDSTNVLAMGYVNSQNQVISGIETRNLIMEAIWNNKHIDFEFDIDQVKYANYARLFGAIDFEPDLTLIKLLPSDLQILDKFWVLDKDNLISITNDSIVVDDLRIFNNYQSISADGKISHNPDDILSIRVDSVHLENLNSVLSKNLAGLVIGKADIQNYYEDMRIESDVKIRDFTIEDFLIGNIEGVNSWDNEEKLFNLKLLVNRLKKNILSINGNYSPDKEKDPLNVRAELKNTEINALEPFFNSFFTEIDGTATGTLLITGTPYEPIINGEGLLNDAKLHVNYLNTNYSLEGGFYFEQNKIGFRNVAVKDSRNQNATVDGYFYHSNFKDFAINLNGSLNNFMVLNTSSTDNDLFYGTGIASGTVDFIGPINNMSINAQATSEKGTRIFIPIGDSESIEKEEYINFVDFEDTTRTQVIENIGKVDLNGLKLNFDLNITPDAYCEIIFDIKSGDIIRGRGNGDIKLQIDTKGDFNMFGDYVIQEGGYNFTLYSIINKEFEILPNSRITWYGDPYKGILDIKATYNQLASFLPLLVQQETDKVYEEVVELKRKYPVKVYLDIDGPLLSPMVNFDILSTNLPRNIKVAERPDVDLEFEFLKFKNSIDEQELKRQVFSLIVLRRFSPLQSFNTGGSITSSVSELLSNQLSYWITQVDENLEIDLDVDFDKFDEEAYNTFQLRLSYTFLDGRLRVTRNGGFGNQTSGTDISSIAGDWTLEYILTPDGKFKAKMYNRTNYNPINPTDENRNTITTGFSITHTQSFDELKELFSKGDKKRKQNKQDENEEDEENEDDTKDDTVNKEGVRDEDDGSN